MLERRLLYALLSRYLLIPLDLILNRKRAFIAMRVHLTAKISRQLFVTLSETT